MNHVKATVTFFVLLKNWYVSNVGEVLICVRCQAFDLIQKSVVDDGLGWGLAQLFNFFGPLIVHCDSLRV